MLRGDSAILATARQVTAALAEAGLRAAVIGGVAVGLHGHLRSTMDVDVWTDEPLDEVALVLRAMGCVWSSVKREFRLAGVPIHLVTSVQAGPLQAAPRTIDDVRVAALSDLLNMKLRSGLRSVVRAQDLADVIALIRVKRLTSAFAARLDRDLRGEFRKLVKAVRSEA